MTDQARGELLGHQRKIENVYDAVADCIRSYVPHKSEQFKTREQAEKAREKYPERLRKRIGIGAIRIKG
jgi:hypothetical protein